MPGDQAPDAQPNAEEEQPEDDRVREMLARIDATLPFGPTFFLRHLGAFVRDCCPDPSEALPFVHVHLSSGDVLDLCHVIGLAPRFVALAVYESGGSARVMRTELVPYEAIVRITVRSGKKEGSHIGFSQEQAPALSTLPEEDLELAATGRH
jgi:hypothetical protein